MRLSARFESYVSFLISYAEGTHDSIRGKPFRQLGVPERVREQLVAARASLRKVGCSRCLKIPPELPDSSGLLPTPPASFWLLAIASARHALHEELRPLIASGCFWLPLIASDGF